VAGAKIPEFTTKEADQRTNEKSKLARGKHMNQVKYLRWQTCPMTNVFYFVLLSGGFKGLSYKEVG